MYGRGVKSVHSSYVVNLKAVRHGQQVQLRVQHCVQPVVVRTATIQTFSDVLSQNILFVAPMPHLGNFLGNGLGVKWGADVKSVFSFVIKCFLMKMSASIKIKFFIPFLNLKMFNIFNFFFIVSS